MGLLGNLALNFNIRSQIGFMGGMKIITGTGNINPSGQNCQKKTV